jgi:tetratricopeptide (TPR) repeat protein
MGNAATLERRLANLRANLARVEHGPSDGGAQPVRRAARPDHAERLAEAIHGEVVTNHFGVVVRCERPATSVPVDRARLASLPGQPPPGTPLVCLDTETTGLGTATGNYAFLVGLGWWVGDRFEQMQLLLPDQPHEAALLEEVSRIIPAGGWLVSYNGRGFDWPLLVTRFRMARRDAPSHAGHLDLLPLVRRLFRHRMGDARLRTVEEQLLGVRRHGDVEGWEIPGRYLDFLRGGPASPLVEVIEHNAEDVRSLARLVAHVESRYGSSDRWADAPPGDLAGLAAAFGDEQRHQEALACLDAALEGPATPVRRTWTSILTTRADAGFGTREPVVDEWQPPSTPGAPRARLVRPPPTPRGTDRHHLLADRARILRRLGRAEEALEAWQDLATGGGPTAATAWVEVAKVLEHRRRDPDAALAATRRALELVERARILGRPLPRLESELALRESRLRRRIGRRRHALPAARGRAERRPEPVLAGP